MSKISMDTSMIDLGVVEVGYWHRGRMIDFDLVTDVHNEADLELIYGKAHILWYGKVAAEVIN